MENYIMLDGKKIEIGAELAEMLAQAVKQEPKKVDPFARTAEGYLYYYIDSDGEVVATSDDSAAPDAFAPTDSERYAIANYCTDSQLMEQRALHETLNRLLWRYSEQHGGDRAWQPLEVVHYEIYRDVLNDKWKVAAVSSTKTVGAVYFREQQTALNAIEEIVMPFFAAHPEFRW